jgi:hypothetical protein
MLLIELVEFLDIHHYIYDLLMYYLRFWCKDSEICSLRTLRTRKKIKICVLCVLRGYFFCIFARKWTIQLI